MPRLFSYLPALLFASTLASAVTAHGHGHAHTSSLHHHHQQKGLLQTTGTKRRCTRRPTEPTLPPTAPSMPPTPPPSSPGNHTSTPSSRSCFPALNFDASGIDSPAESSTPSKWWCKAEDEYAFLGFSYAVESCPSKDDMLSSFKKMRKDYNARYIRVYASCDNDGFWGDLIHSAYQANLGVYALIWFGFNGDDAYVGRLEKFMNAVKDNDIAPFVVRSLAVGSEAIFDHAIPVDKLVSTIGDVKSRLSQIPNAEHIEVSTSDMPYLLAQNKDVTDAADNIELNLLPFFSQDATTGKHAKGEVQDNLAKMKDATDGKKKVIMTQTGWPSNADVWKPNSQSAAADVDNEKAYYDLLDGLCENFKEDGPVGGYAWFAHMYDDSSLPGWGITKGGEAKFTFKPRTSC